MATMYSTTRPLMLRLIESALSIHRICRKTQYEFAWAGEIGHSLHAHRCNPGATRLSTPPLLQCCPMRRATQHRPSADGLAPRSSKGATPPPGLEPGSSVTGWVSDHNISKGNALLAATCARRAQRTSQWSSTKQSLCVVLVTRPLATGLGRTQ